MWFLLCVGGCLFSRFSSPRHLWALGGAVVGGYSVCLWLLVAVMRGFVLFPRCGVLLAFACDLGGGVSGSLISVGI